MVNIGATVGRAPKNKIRKQNKIKQNIQQIYKKIQTKSA